MEIRIEKCEGMSIDIENDIDRIWKVYRSMVNVGNDSSERKKMVFSER